MSKTKIEWATDVWNPTVGCTKVSAGCKNCYAERDYGHWFPDVDFSKVQLKPERLQQPFHWKKPRRIFVDSVSDLFHKDVPDEFIQQVFTVMISATWHIFMILTKRPKRMFEIINRYKAYQSENIWLGVSIEDQKTADERIPLLLQTPAAVRFLSCEPLLELIDLSPYLGYTANIGETGYEQSNERRNIIPIGYKQGMEDRQVGSNMERGKENRAQVSQRIFTSSENGKRLAINNRCSQISLLSFQGENTSRNNDQSFERDKERQQTRKLGISYIFKESTPCISNGFEGSERGEESSIEIDESTSRTNKESILRGKYHTRKIGERIWGSLSDNFQNSEGGITNETTRNGNGLYTKTQTQKQETQQERSIHLVIVGCESGPAARPMDLDWARSLRDQCQVAGVPFFLKQAQIDGKLVKMPALDGKIWDEYPKNIEIRA